MLQLSHFKRALTPKSLVLAGVVTLASSYACCANSTSLRRAFASSIKGQTPPHTSRVTHASTNQSVSHIVKESSLYRRTRIKPTAKKWCSAADPITVSFAISEDEIIDTVEGGDAGTGNTILNLKVTRSGDLSGTTTVYYDTLEASGTGYATGDEDFERADSTVTFAPGESSVDLPITIINDSQYEDSSPDAGELFAVELYGAEDSSGNDVYAGDYLYNYVEIIDDDSVLLFDPTSTTVRENVGTTNLTVSRIGSTLRDATVSYSTTNGTARSGQDYQRVTNGRVTIPSGSTTATFPVTIVDDVVQEDDEDFTIALSNPSLNSTVGDSNVLTVNIADNDSIDFNFSQRSYTFPENVGNAGIVVTRDTGTDSQATVQYRTIDGTATVSNDYTSTTGTLTFAPGVTSQTIPVPINQDTIDEDTETFVVQIFGSSSAPSPTLTRSVNVSITDDDDPPSLSFTNAAATNEGQAGESPKQNFVLTLSSVSGKRVTVHYTTSDGSATLADNDYVRADGNFTIEPGNKTAQLPITLVGDIKYEDDETYVLTLSDSTDSTLPTNATLLATKRTGTIKNDDAAPVSVFSLSVNPTTVSETQASVPVTVTRTGDTTTTATITLSTADGTAKAREDYTSVNTVLQFPASSASATQIQTVNVPISNDSLNEATETFSVSLSNPTGNRSTSTLGAKTSETISITDDDPLPVVSVNSVKVNEGDSGTVNLTFIVSLNTDSAQTVTVNYATADGSATAPSDYTATSGTLTFAPATANSVGETSKQVTVQVNGDTDTESDETFSFNLSSPTNATLDNNANSGTGTIANDDIPLIISDFAYDSGSLQKSVSEIAGTVTLTVIRTQGDNRAASIDYTTSDGTAVAGSDYTATSGTLTFAVGQTSANIVIPILDDNLKENSETFTVTLSNPSATATAPVRNMATVTIEDDEGSPMLSIANASVVEGNSGTTSLVFTVSLNPQSQKAVTVVASTVAGGTATSASGRGQDYQTSRATLTFAPGAATQTFSVPVIGDSIVEPDETVNVALSNASGAPISKATAIGTIVNDDVPGGGGRISFLSPSYSVTEGAGTATITIGRAGNVDMINQQGATVRVTTGTGTASSASDYRSVNSIITFAKGETTKSFTIPIINDTVFESDETIPLTLSEPSDNAILGNTTQATLTIRDDDPRSTVPRADTLTPSNPTGSVFTVTSTYSSDQGVNDVSPVLIQVGGNINGGGFRALYDQRTNRLSLDPTGGTSVAPGTNRLLSNQYGSLDCSRTRVQKSGNTLTVTWAIRLGSSFTKAQSIYLGATGVTTGESVFVRKGTWSPSATTTNSAGGA